MTIPPIRGECNARSLPADLGNLWANNFGEGAYDPPSGIGSFDLGPVGPAHRPMQPGPQPQNQIAGTCAEQYRRALRPRRSHSSVSAVKSLLARIRATEAGLRHAAHVIAKLEHTQLSLGGSKYEQ